MHSITISLNQDTDIKTCEKIVNELSKQGALEITLSGDKIICKISNRLSYYVGTTMLGIFGDVIKKCEYERLSD